MPTHEAQGPEVDGCQNIGANHAHSRHSDQFLKSTQLDISSPFVPVPGLSPVLLSWVFSPTPTSLRGDYYPGCLLIPAPPRTQIIRGYIQRRSPLTAPVPRNSSGCPVQAHVEARAWRQHFLQRPPLRFGGIVAEELGGHGTASEKTKGPELLRNMLSSTVSGPFAVSVLPLYCSFELNSHECLACITAPTDCLGPQTPGLTPSEENMPQT